MGTNEEKFEGFELLMKCHANDSILVKKYRSFRTELVVIIADVPGPLVNGYFIVATEANTDDGLPHTLEHLIFLGSHDYPFKGTLDIIANRCLASGTNAWTDIDHTAYTVFTAGEEGFLSLLPVYLDHLFFPILKHSSFLTEVYHVTEEGKDSGVVYCEMQGRENSAECITQIELMRALYQKNCGYRYETGGILSNLRNSTTNTKIRQFHEEFYCPKNTTIVIAGKIDEAKLFSTIYKFEEKLLNISSKRFQKAWQTPVPIMTHSDIRGITYPSDHEDNGIVLIGWQGPSVVNDYYRVIATQILFKYLTETAVSPLMKYFVENDDPFCSDISVTAVENSIPVLYCTFQNVVIKKIARLYEKLFDCFRLIETNTNETYKICKNRMKSVIQRFALKQLLAFEKDPQNEIAFALIGDVLYGKSSCDMFNRLNHQVIADKLLEEPVLFWISLLKEYFIDRPYALVLAFPSKNENLLRSYFETERINSRHNSLGEEGLRKKGEELKKAIEENEILPPDNLIASVSVPSTDNLNFHSIRRYSSISEIQHPDFSLKYVPVFTQLDDVDSKFIYAYVMMDSSKLKKELRLYLPLFLEYILACPINRNNSLISYEKVVAELEEDIVEVATSIGVKSNKRFACGEYSFIATLYMSMIHKNFEKGINWIKELLYESVFTQDRLKVITQKLLSSISQLRRQPDIMIKQLHKLMLFNPDTNYSQCTVLWQLKFLTEVFEKLHDEEQSKEVIEDLSTLRKTLTNPSNLVFHISTNVTKLVSKFKNPAENILKIIPENEKRSTNKFEIPQDHMYLSPAIGKSLKGCVVGMASADSAFVYHSTCSINDFNHPDLPALLVFIQYMTQVEGPMWRDIRGHGLAYYYNLILQPNEGTLSLLLGRSVDPVQSFRRSRKIFDENISAVRELNSLHFESAKSSLIFEIVNREKNIANISFESVLSHFRGTSEDYNRTLIQKIYSVKLDDMEEVVLNYIISLFDPSLSVCTIICNCSKVKEIVDCFRNDGYDLVPFLTLEDSYMNPSFIEAKQENL